QPSRAPAPPWGRALRVAARAPAARGHPALGRRAGGGRPRAHRRWHDMPHEFESGVFTEGRPAWHGLGTVLPNDSLDSAEALTYSGLDGWHLTKQPIYVGNPEDGYRQIPDHF